MVDLDKIRNVIKPENDLEREIINDKEFFQGVNYGKPRKGHPEGKVLFHIGEVLANVDKYYGDDPERSKLRLLAIIHDSFKYKVDRSKPKYGDNHHGHYASVFAQKYVDNSQLKYILIVHDDAYNAWQAGNRRGRWDVAEKRGTGLGSDLFHIDALDLFLKFYYCDNKTGNKTNEDYEWFYNLV